MAQVTGGQLRPIDFGTTILPDRFGDVTIADWMGGTASAQTGNGFTLAISPELEIRYSGTNFTYDSNGDVVDGEISGISVTSSSSGELWLAFDALGISVVDFRAYVAAGNTQGFLAVVLGGSDSITGADEGDGINGHDGNDFVGGGGGDDTLTGGNGDDTIDGGSGGDRMGGGSGNDTYIVDDPLDVIDEAYGSGVDTVLVESEIYNLGAAGYGAIENIEIEGTLDRAIVVGNDLDNRIVSSRNQNFLQGLGGNDTITVAGGDDFVNGGVGDDSIDGSGGNDYLTGMTGNDTLVGGDGNDTLIGDGGADLLQGGAGDDLYYVIDSTDIVDEAAAGTAGGIDRVIFFGSQAYALGASIENLLAQNASTAIGNDLENRITSGTGNNRLFGLAGNDSLDGAAGNDSLDGGAGSDTLGGGSGADSLNGGAGDDSYLIDNVSDRIAAEAAGAAGGVDTVTSAVTFTLGANLENLALSGTATINGTGNGLSNLITGNSSANRIAGGAGHDTISGGGGNDSLNGGAGNDEFRYISALDGHDLIAGFDGGPAGGQDHLDLDTLFDGLAVATADRAGRMQITDRGAAVDVRVDSDGDGLFDLFAATLQTPNVISAGNGLGDDVILGTL